jgi:hypothetical protein
VGSVWKAHRVAWTLANGPIPAGMHVLHTCDNPPCCNPGHLWLGTQADNMADMARKGRTSNQFLRRLRDAEAVPNPTLWAVAS